MGITGVYDAAGNEVENSDSNAGAGRRRRGDDGSAKITVVVEECPKIEWSGSIKRHEGLFANGASASATNGEMINDANNAPTQILLAAVDVSNGGWTAGGVTAVHFQYRVEGAAKWTTISAAGSLRLDESNYLDTSGIDITNVWDISDLDAFPDGIYALRAITVCGQGTQSATDVIVGKIDRTAPKLLYAESLATRPTFTSDDQVSSTVFGMFNGNPFPVTITLTEPVLCMGLNPATELPIVSVFTLTIFGTVFGGPPELTQQNLRKNADLHFKCIGDKIELTFTAAGLTKFGKIDRENGNTQSSPTVEVNGIVDHAGNVMPTVTSPVATSGFANIAKQLTQVTDTNVNMVGKQLDEKLTLMWEYMEDLKQEVRLSHKYTRDMISEIHAKPTKERKILLALPMTYQQCFGMNVDDHKATDANIAFQVVDITLEHGSNAWQETAKTYGDPFSVNDIKDVVIRCHDPLDDPCVLTASCTHIQGGSTNTDHATPEAAYQEAVATVIFHASLTQSAYDNVATEVNAAANEDRLPVAAAIQVYPQYQKHR